MEKGSKKRLSFILFSPKSAHSKNRNASYASSWLCFDFNLGLYLQLKKQIFMLGFKKLKMWREESSMSIQLACISC